MATESEKQSGASRAIQASLAQSLIPQRAHQAFFGGSGFRFFGNPEGGAPPLEDRGAEPVRKAAASADPDMGDVAKGLRRLSDESPEFTWLANLAERHAAMTASQKP